MDEDWEKLWKEDLMRRAAEAQAPLEPYKAKLNEYAARVDMYRARAQAAVAFAEEHPLIRTSAEMAAPMKLERPAAPLIDSPSLPDFPEPPKI